MPHTLTIASRAFTVKPRYAAGHTLSEAEAVALNQTFFENLRNNFAKQAKDGADQAKFDEYAKAYAFGVRSVGGGSRDPIHAEALNLAREAIKNQLQSKGIKLSAYTQAQYTAAAEKLVAEKPEYLTVAKQRVEQARAVAGGAVGDDLLSAISAAASEPAASEEAAPVEATSAEAAKETLAKRGAKGQ